MSLINWHYLWHLSIAFKGAVSQQSCSHIRIASNKNECQALLAHLVVHLVCAYNVFVHISGTWDGTANLLSEVPSCDMESGITSHKVYAQNIRKSRQ